MKAIKILSFLFAISLVAVVLDELRIFNLKMAVAARETALAESKTEAENAKAQLATPDPELARLREANNELIKLRGEFNALRAETAAFRKEKEDLAKKLSAAEARAVARPELAAPGQPAAAGAPPKILGSHGALLRQKLLSGQPLTPAEQTDLQQIRAQVAELEKTPESFGAYQSAYIASLLGWNNDPRADQLERMLTSATRAAQTRGLTFNAPGQTPDNWTEAQQQLNNRVSSGVGALLNDQEKTLVHAGVAAIMSAEIPAAPRPQ